MKRRIIIIVLLAVFALVVCVGVALGYFGWEGGLPTKTPQETTAATSPAPTQPVVATQPIPQPTEDFTDPTEEDLAIPMPDITWKTFPPERVLTSTKAFVYDCGSESYLYLLGEPKEKIYPASITKLMSIHVASQYLDPDWELAAGSILDRIPEDASVAKLEKGDILTVDMLLEAMLLPSGNDAAYLIATEAGREIAGNPDLGVDDAIDAFVGEMNRQAQALGMTGTQYKNPDGWHDEAHFTCFDDLVTIAKVALKNETVKKYGTVPKTTVTPVFGHDKEWINTNLLVNPETEYYCPYTIGLKTGQTEAAGSCLLSAFDIEGRVFIIGVFGSPKFNDKLDDTLQLLNDIVMTGSN